MIRSINTLFKNIPSRTIFPRFVHAQKLCESDVEEIKIPVPWGHIAGKWWGSKDQRPILCLHGWQDNAGSFDNLIPLLPSEYSYLALDLPGHGLSSHLQKGLFYLGTESFITLRRIQKYFNWSKLSFISHSLGSIHSFMYSAVFPDDVDFYIGLDAMKPPSNVPEKNFKKATKKIEDLFHLELLDVATAPTYTEEQLLSKWMKSSSNSLTTESCKVLMKRGSINVYNGVKLTRDPKLKTSSPFGFTHKEITDMANNIKCNVCILKFDWRFYDNEDNFNNILNIIENKCKHFEYHKVDGTHHSHLNTPHNVAPVIVNYLNKIKNDVSFQLLPPSKK